MTIQVELNPHVNDPSWIEKHSPTLRALSKTFFYTVEGGWCDLPENIDMYHAIVFAIDTQDHTEKVVGFATAIASNANTLWTLSAAMLEDDFRNNHIGSAMARELITYARTQGAQTIWTYTKNERMIDFLVKNGFDRTVNSFILSLPPE